MKKDKKLGKGVFLLCLFLMPFVFQMALIVYGKDFQLIRYFPVGTQTLEIGERKATRIDTVYYQVPNQEFVGPGQTPFDLDDIKENKIIAHFLPASRYEEWDRQLTILNSLISRYEKVDVLTIMECEGRDCDQDYWTPKKLKQVEHQKNRWKFALVDGERYTNLKDKVFDLDGTHNPEGYNYVLMDTDRVIRGYYPAANLKEARKIMNSLKTLQAEYHIPKKPEIHVKDKASL